MSNEISDAMNGTEDTVTPHENVAPIKFNVEPEPIDTSCDTSLLVEEITTKEVSRMSRNLAFLDSIESNLKEQVTFAMQSGVVGIDTLLDIMDAFGKSVDRSNKIINGNNKEFINLLIDNRSQVHNDTQTVINGPVIDLDKDSRNKIRNVVDAILEASTAVTPSEEEE